MIPMNSFFIKKNQEKKENKEENKEKLRGIKKIF